MEYSNILDEFLTFLRDAQQNYNIAILGETEANDETQDILHRLELTENSYHDTAKLAKALKAVRQNRRNCKDTKEILEPIVNWADSNRKVIKELEIVLGTMRKTEKNKASRIYLNKTEVVNNTLGIKEDASVPLLSEQHIQCRS